MWGLSKGKNLINATLTEVKENYQKEALLKNPSVIGEIKIFFEVDCIQLLYTDYNLLNFRYFMILLICWPGFYEAFKL